MSLKICVALRRIQADDNDLLHDIMTAKALAPEFHMYLTPVAWLYSTLCKCRISTATGRPCLLDVEILAAYIGKPEIVNHCIAFVYLAKIHCIDVKLNYAS